MSENEKKIAIEYIDVCKRFPNASYNAVDHVSLQIETGTIVTILGTSGSGKTTLLKMTNRIHELTSGEIRYFGKNINELDLNTYRRQLGYVIQQAGLFPHKNVEANIATVPKLLGWDKERINARVEELMNMVQLDPGEFRKRYPRQLSGGQQQRVGIAPALAASPSVILMDEPFGAIDAITREALQDQLIGLQYELKNTILFVTHDIQEALKLGHKVIVMDSGKVQQYDTPYNIMLNPANDYVRNLVSTGDFYDKLRVLTVNNIIEEASSEELREGTVIPAKTYISEALGILLKTGETYLRVEDMEGRLAGKITFERVQQMVR